MFSIYELEPNTSYTIKLVEDIEQIIHTFKTEQEVICINVKKIGAVGDGIQDDTRALQSAIMSCPTGGRVYVPSGNYLSRPLYFKSDMTLELAKGATLLGVTDRHAYEILPGRVDDDELNVLSHLVTWEGVTEP